ncbi:MAG: twin-arginine translocase subunit TatB [Phenylobacterium sp.]|nr:MAG: twin-arginine translocase subunit TatB [Phenylobacterium sp.]
MFPEGRALELMIAAVIALVVVGPKDLPILLRRVGQFMAKLRGMAAEFRASFDEMARQSELDDLRKEVDALRKGQLAEIAAGSSHAELNQAVDEIHQSLADVGVQLHPPMSYQYSEAAAEPAPQTTIAIAEPKPKARPRAKTAATAKPAAAKKVTAKTAAPAKASAAAKPTARKAPAKGAQSRGKS